MWRHDGSPEQDRLNAYWDAAVGGASPEASARAAPDLDPNLLDTVNRARLLHRRNRPDPAFAVHLESVLMNAFATTYPKSTVIQPVQPKRLVTRPAWLPAREEIFPRRWSLAAIATVALIAITIAAFFFSLRNSHHPALVPGTPVAAPTSTPVPSPTAVPVTMYRGNLERTGVMPGPAPAGRPGVLWRSETGSVVKGPVVVGNGLVYTGTDDGSVHAFDMTTGGEVWKLTGNTAIESPSIVLDGATAFVSGYDGMLLSVDAATGAELWRTDPALNVSRRVAFDAESKTLFVGGLDPVSYAFDSSTGQLKWQVDIQAPQASVASVVAGDTLYFGVPDGPTYALNTADGSTKWTVPDGFGSLTFANGTIFGPTGTDPDFVYAALDAASGAERWRISSPGFGFTPGTIVDGNIVVGTDAGKLMSVAQTDGAVNWTFTTVNGAGVWGAPAIVGDEVYAVDIDGSLYALDAATGQELWQVKLDGGVNYSPVITGGVIYLGTWTGSVYALSDEGMELSAATPVTTLATPAASPGSSPVAETSGDVELLWETTGGDVGLAGPSTLTIAPDGRIWVADSGHAGFQILDADGAFLESWTGTGDGQFGLVQSDGDPFGTVAFAPDGSFYVLDPGARRILAFSASRTFVRSIGEPGRGPGQFREPIAIAADPAGNVAAWDPGRGDVQTFTPDGTLVATTRLKSTYTGAYSSNSMAIDGDGNFYVLQFDQAGPALVEKFDPEGNLLLQFGLESGPGKLLGQPLGIGLDATGNVYVTEIEPGRVVVYSPEGEYLMDFAAAGDATVEIPFPFDVAVDSQGDAYVTDLSQSRLVKLRLPQSLTPATPTP
jgi:outer membrane protein assembly factor BamB